MTEPSTGFFRTTFKKSVAMFARGAEQPAGSSARQGAEQTQHTSRPEHTSTFARGAEPPAGSSARYGAERTHHTSRPEHTSTFARGAEPPAGSSARHGAEQTQHTSRHIPSLANHLVHSLVAPLLPPEALCTLACTSRALRDLVYAASEDIWAGCARHWAPPRDEPFAGLGWRATVCALWREQRAIHYVADRDRAEADRDQRALAVSRGQQLVLSIVRELPALEARTNKLSAELVSTSSMRERAAQWNIAAMRTSPFAAPAPLPMRSSEAETVRRELTELRKRISELRIAKEDAKAQLRAAGSAHEAALRRVSQLSFALATLSDELAGETSGVFYTRMSAEFACGKSTAARSATSFFAARCAAWRGPGGLTVVRPACEMPGAVASSDGAGTGIPGHDILCRHSARGPAAHILAKSARPSEPVR
ncbi:hypothetical protein T492DRAFT_1122113 [Pavlovales sp. CCMP2436]|nr:hypothetical protein T492DRAFT_1122113 [Pavlovales sp. CCMP2436]